MKKREEIKHQDKFIEHVGTLKKVVALRLKLVGLKGWPDFTVCFNGYIFFIEFKDGDNDLSRQQIKWRRILLLLKFKYYIVYSCDEAKNILKKEMERHYR